MKVSAKDKVFLVLKYVVLGIFTVLCLYPLLWLFLSSFKTIRNCTPIPGGCRSSLGWIIISRP